MGIEVAQVLVADRYRLESPIGRGAMGEVWRATDEVLGRPVALKLMLGDDSRSEAAARFRLEGRTAARLSHPHVVAVFDFGAWDNRFYLVMELVEGRSLAQELSAAGRLAPERVATIAAQTAAGLASAHRQGIVHRDIKPGNLMSDAQGSVKLGDFGIARFLDDPGAALTTAGQIVGTSLYLAPERALGRQAGPASDVYSLGCVLYQLLTGRPPFQADTATGTLYLHIDTEPVPPGRHGVQVPAAFESYLLGLLAKQPEDRPGAQEVADWFNSGAWRGSAPLPVPATPAAASAPLPEPARPPAPASGPGHRSVPSHRAAPAAHRSAAPAHRSAPAPHRSAGPSYRSAAPGPAAPAPGALPLPEPAPSATTYALPPAGGRSQGRGRRAAAPARRPGGAREFVRRRPRVASAIAGSVAFLVCTLLGMAWFGSDDTGRDTPAVESPAGLTADGTP
ncbi:serine/threonine protein kinase [Streptomyces sp. LP05-1]|uniref:non-specific serine/threonine protein kinase n=1 Tax=Streptomyces pyxinae TaxID=2970734 RepID=A0ABT2CCD3_9ACTN|nr:serine/threonine-protein kinase [Streptomyces sp. LP05-1]MCS0635068.1 serine/threonine protein kinase [Streptomyces sp. LP05-1]